MQPSLLTDEELLRLCEAEFRDNPIVMELAQRLADWVDSYAKPEMAE